MRAAANRKRGAAGVDASCACFNIRKAARAVTQFYDEALRPTGLGANQLSLLAVTAHVGPVAVKGLADATLMDRTTVTRNLRPLEREGLIHTSRGEDRREKEVVVTRRGKAMLKRALPLWRRAQSQVIGRLGEKRFGRLLSDLSATIAVTRSP